MRKFFLILILVPLLYACKSSKKVRTVTKSAPIGVQFVEGKYFSEIVEIAKAEDKLVFIDFVADWCLPCKIMDEEVYSNKEIGNYFNENFINFKVDIDEEIGANIAAIYEVLALPTLVFTDTSGIVLERVQGAIFHDDLMAHANSAAVKFNTAE